MRNFEDQEQLKPIVGFPGYVVTSFGRVINTKFEREMVLSPTLEGVVTVGLMYEGRQYRRSVKVLVARAFVEGETEIFNTPVQLDGDKWNLRSDNIVWRPRWFAWRYARQMFPLKDWYDMGPIMETNRRIRYATIFEAATSRGLLCADIRMGILSGKRIFPTGDRFVLL